MNLFITGLALGLVVGFAIGSTVVYLGAKEQIELLSAQLEDFRKAFNWM